MTSVNVIEARLEAAYHPCYGFDCRSRAEAIFDVLATMQDTGCSQWAAINVAARTHGFGPTTIWKWMDDLKRGEKRC